MGLNLKLFKVRDREMLLKINICLTVVFLSIVFVSPLSAAEILPKLQKSWNKSRCSEFFAIDSPKAHFLAKKCSGKKGRWLRACIRSKNLKGHFDGILNNFVTFSEWKCYSAITAYHSNNPKQEPDEFNLDNNLTPSASADSPSQNMPSEQLSEKLESARKSSSTEKDIGSRSSIDTTDNSSVTIKHVSPSLKDLVQTIDNLQRKIESLDKRIINLESKQR